MRPFQTSDALGASGNGEASAMSEQKESSVLFNLKELMALEEDRIQTEEVEAKRKADDEARRRADEEARIKAEAEAKRRAEEDARLAAERSAREEEETRLREREEAALRVRLDAEARSRAEEQQRQLEHERKLREIEAQKKGIPPIALAAVVLLAIGGLAGGYYGVYLPGQQRAQAQVAEKERLARMRAEETQRIADELAAKEREAARLAEEKKLAEAEARAKTAEAAAAQASARPSAPAGSSSDGPRPARRAKHERAEASGGSEPKRGGGDDPLAGLDDL